jgi:hypothetical protein
VVYSEHNHNKQIDPKCKKNPKTADEIGSQLGENGIHRIQNQTVQHLIQDPDHPKVRHGKHQNLCQIVPKTLIFQLYIPLPTLF